jgi:hypothetical protein
MNRRVVCSAVQCQSTYALVLGARHFDTRMHKHIALFKRINSMAFTGDYIEGFIDTWGNFLTRTEAWKVAADNGQIIRNVGGDQAKGGTLYSENLY